MIAEFDTSSLEAKILLLLVEAYPITIGEIAEYLKSSRQRVERTLKLLVSKGLVLLEPLPDKTYASLSSTDFRLKGKKTEQLKKVEEKLKKWRKQSHDYDGMMFG